MEPHDFKCRWIEKEELWKITEDFRQAYWPQKDLPVNTETIVEFRLRLDIDPKHGHKIENLGKDLMAGL